MVATLDKRQVAAEANTWQQQLAAAPTYPQIAPSIDRSAAEESGQVIPERRSRALYVRLGKQLDCASLEVFTRILMDGFKEINDRHGHLAGDHILCAFANRLRNCLRASDTAARFGGDEFGAILENIHHEQEAHRLLHQILTRVCRNPVHLDCGEVWLRASIGLAIYPQHGTTPRDLLRQADESMYRAKAQSKRKANRRPALFFRLLRALC